MTRHLTILYRGPLSSCNYGCVYCPFAKHRETRAELQEDEKALARFVEWCRDQQEEYSLSILFTPWGEGLVRAWYREALVELTQMRHMRKVAIQTNLSPRLGWVSKCDLARLGLWSTYHPTETTRSRFLSQCRELDRLGARYSVGMVGLREHFDEIEAVRRELNPDTYLWINAYKREPGYYSDEDIVRLSRIDPLFPINNTRHPSLGRSCRTGDTVISVDGEGTARRCHFVRETIGNIYDRDFHQMFRERPCPNETCGCHIGYVHLDELDLYVRFGEGLLERIPDGAALA